MMTSYPPLRGFTHVALAALALLPAVGAPYPTAPPVPSLAPRAGVSTELFNGVTLAARPAPGAKVEGWYPLSLPDYEGENGGFLEVPPALFDAPAGVLRVVPSDGPFGSGRTRQIPSSTEISIDVYFGNESEFEIEVAGLSGDFDATADMPGLSMYLWRNPVDLDAPNAEAEEAPASQWAAVGPSFFAQLEGDFSNKWVRLEIKIDENSKTVTYLVDGEVVHAGPIDENVQEGDPAPKAFFTEANLIFLSSQGFERSETESGTEAESSEILFFLDNFSFNGAAGAADLTVGKKRPSGSHVGNNLYGSAENQLFTIERRFNLRASAWFSLQNDGATADEMSIVGKGRGSSQVKVKTFALDGSKRVNVTGKIATGSFKATIEPGKEISLLSEAKLTARAKKTLARRLGKVLSRTQTLRASSAGNPAGNDSARAVFNFNSLIPRSRGGY